MKQNICIRDAETEELYIDIKYSGIPPLIILVEGIPTTTFTGLRRRYAELDRVIQWHRDELEAGDSSSKVCVDTLTQLKEKFQPTPVAA